MKSAYELAMERLGGSRSYTNGQKQQMAEIDRKLEEVRSYSKMVEKFN